MKEIYSTFGNLKTYASFLYNNHIQAVIDFSFAKVKEEQIHLMGNYQVRNEENLYLLWKENFVDNFLQYLTQDHPLAGFIERIDKWTAGQIPLPGEQLLLEDILSIHHIRKLALLEFIPLHTTDATEMLAIVKEIESCSKLIEKYALQTYNEINRSKLEEKEKVLNGLLSNIPVIVTRMDTNGIIKESVGAGLKSLNLSNDYLAGRKLFALYPDSKNVERVVNERKFISFEGQAGSKANRRYFQNYFFPEGDEILGFSIDITEHKTAAEALKETQHYISRIAYTSPDTLYIYNLQENRIVYLNRDTSETLGYSTDEIYALGSNIIDTLVHPEEANGFKEHFRQFSSAKDKEVRETEFRFRNKQWEWRHLLTRETVFKRTPAGVPYEVIGILRDITEQKEAEEEIRYKTRLLDKLLYNFPISIGRIDTNGTFLESRGLGVHKFGSYDNEIVGLNVFENFPSMVEPVKKILAGETIEFIGYTDYKSRTIYYKNYGFFDQEKNCVIILAVEITELKEAEAQQKKLTDELELKVLERTKELASREEQLRLITDSLPVLITYIDNNELYRFNNKTYEEWFGIPRQKVYGLSVKEVVGERVYERIKDYIQMALRGQEVSFEIELPYKFGSRYVSIDYVPRFERKKVLGFYALVTDISERKHSEIAIEKALQATEAKNQELVKINQLLDNFVYMAAHDLKSPVSNIKVLIGMLGNTSDSSEKPELLAAVQESINRLDSTIEGLVEVIEIQSINNIPTKKIGFQSTLNQIMADASNDLEKCNGHILSDFSHCPYIDYIDPFLLSIMRNLVTNAIKYHSPARNLEIRITTQRNTDFVVLTVADNGIGMDLNRYGQHLFKPFTRFTNKARGKGLGLHLVKTMVEKNGGLIKVESRIDAGTVFRIFLKEY